jgi:hypothetical protein
MRTMSTSATNARIASASSEVAGPKAAASAPASAGPATSAALNELASRALAGASSSSGTIWGIRLVKPPKESG